MSHEGPYSALVEILKKVQENLQEFLSLSVTLWVLPFLALYSKNIV